MIESRTQRKKSSLLRRRKIAIFVTLAIVVVLGVILAIVYNYVNTVIPYYDVDDTEYHIKQVNGVYLMYDKQGKLLPVVEEFGYYKTNVGTLLMLDPATGEIKERVIPDFYDPSLSETVDHQKILIFPSLESEDISTIRIYNSKEPQGYTLMRYNLETMLADNESDFVLMYNNMESTMLTLKKDLVAALYVAAGYSLATGKIDPAEVAKHGYAEYGLVEGTRTRRSWFYLVEIDVDGKQYSYRVHADDGRLLSEEEVGEYIEPTYDMGVPTVGFPMAEAIALAKNDLAPSRDSKVKYTCTLKAYDETYEHIPASYIVATTTGERYKMVIGDRLINGAGYYAQYVDVETGEVRPTVYTLAATIESTLLAPAMTIVEPMITYPTTTNDYFDVDDFTVSQKQSDALGDYKDVISFSYIDLEDREDTVEGIHPYKFSSGEFVDFRPNYDNIDICLVNLMDTTINKIVMLSPTALDKIAYGLAKPELDENGNVVTDVDGNVKAVYDSEYKVTFYRTRVDEDGKEHRFLQTIYISSPNADGNYYVNTVIDFPEFPLSLDMICEVSAKTLNFLQWDRYDWVYPEILETALTHVETLEINVGGVDYIFKVIQEKQGEDTNVLYVEASSSDGKAVTTFGILNFKDSQGNSWTVTPSDIKVFAPDGTELKPSSRHYEYNSVDEQVRVIDTQVLMQDGRRIRITADNIYITHPGGGEETILRYHTTLFKKLFTLTTSISIVDQIDMTDEEEAALVNDPENYVATIKLTDDTGRTMTVEYFHLTNRKMYFRLNGQGGFYVSSSHVKKGLDAIGFFFDGVDFDRDY